MNKRYKITVHMTDEGETYDIEHEADAVLLEIANRLYFGDPDAKKEWEPFREIWPELMEIEENEDGALDFDVLEYFDDDPDQWPGRMAFWIDAMESGVPGVGLSIQGFPGGTELYRIEGEDSLHALITFFADKYEFIEGEPWV
jgi:hypothetical protein